MSFVAAAWLASLVEIAFFGAAFLGAALSCGTAFFGAAFFGATFFGAAFFGAAFFGAAFFGAAFLVAAFLDTAPLDVTFLAAVRFAAAFPETAFRAGARVAAALSFPVSLATRFRFPPSTAILRPHSFRPTDKGRDRDTAQAFVSCAEPPFTAVPIAPSPDLPTQT